VAQDDVAVAGGHRRRELLLPGDGGAQPGQPLDLAIEGGERPGGAPEVEPVLHLLPLRYPDELEVGAALRRPASGAGPVGRDGHTAPPERLVPELRHPRRVCGVDGHAHDVHAGPSPHPPPPGVSMRSTSPGARWTVHLSARRSARASSPPGSSQVSPGAPGPPPARPGGLDARRSVMSDIVTASSTWRSRSIP